MFYDLIIIGAGPAGVSAAIYAKSRGANLLVLERNQVGGLIRNVSKVTHYTGIIKEETGISLASRMEEQLKEYAIIVKNEEVVETNLKDNIKTIITNKETYQAKKVIIACGTNPKRLWVKGEERLTGKGVRMNASLHKGLYVNKKVMVVGGADGAVKEALFLSNFVAKVYLVVVEDSLVCIDEFKKKILTKNNIEVIYHSSVKEFVGSDKLESVIIKNNKTNDETTINCDGEFSYIGSSPASGIFNEVNMQDGYILTNSMMETNLEGVYACGDIINKKVRQVATAVAEGAIAAISALTK